MNVQLLIDAIVRQTTVLLAQLATSGGVRAPLVHIANQVFLDLAEELHAQGVSRKVSADMFGLALRTYLRKIQRVKESSTERGRSLWEAVLDYLSQERLVTRAEVLQRFHRDDTELVQGVLYDLSESGLVLRIGSGAGTAYRAATAEELTALSDGETPSDGTDELVWALIYREGPVALETLTKLTRRSDLESVLGRLVATGRVQRSAASDKQIYSARELFVPVDAATGWEAAVYDHFHALVQTICVKLHASDDGVDRRMVGGSTYSFEVWPGHPFEEEVLSQLETFRTRTSELRARVREYNDQQGRPAVRLSVTFYAGQCVVPHEEETNAPKHA